MNRQTDRQTHGLCICASERGTKCMVLWFETQQIRAQRTHTHTTPYICPDCMTMMMTHIVSGGKSPPKKVPDTHTLIHACQPAYLTICFSSCSRQTDSLVFYVYIESQQHGSNQPIRSDPIWGFEVRERAKQLASFFR